MRRITELDGLRGLAVLIVFLYHYGGGAHSQFLPLHVAGLVVSAGWTGVSLFFVLSGFLITGILWESRADPHRLRNFYGKRTFRIFPLYYLSLGLVLLAAAFAGTFHAAVSRIYFPALFLQDVPGPPNNAILSSGSPLSLSHFWSLAIEEHFYLAWPFLLFLQKTPAQAKRLCVAVMLFSVCMWSCYWFLPAFAAHTPYIFNRCGEMAIGGWLAFAYKDETWPRVRRAAAWVAPLALLTFAVTWHAPYQLNVFALPAMTLFYAGLLVLSISGGWISWCMNRKALRWLGSISYGVYVYHVLLGVLFKHLTTRIVPQSAGNKFFAVQFLVAAVCSLAISWLSFTFFEKPLLRISHARFGTGRVPAHAPASDPASEPAYLSGAR